MIVGGLLVLLCRDALASDLLQSLNVVLPARSAALKSTDGVGITENIGSREISAFNADAW